MQISRPSNQIASSLNLARKWRSKTFDTIIGQTLSVRMLKNSLFLNYFFPVYLFAGQRGCGKTTTARIFASAINCENLPNFQKNPKEFNLPCLQCISCKAMATVSHPDFIEMDAASHTGVDNVRVIIDAASLLPVLGRKKIYLIDEAHMLSKAAFNAFLKILEEPPSSVLFMLATTDPHKIIETVRSRCFQLFFRAITDEQLLKHLQTICNEESIAYDDFGLQLVIRQSQGSARDAINLLESVRFSAQKIDKESVYYVLGQVPDDILLQLLKVIANGNMQAVIQWLQQYPLEQYRAQAIWDSFLELIRAILWFSYGQPLASYAYATSQFSQIMQGITASLLCTWLEIFYSYELLFLKTASQHRLFETIILHLCNTVKNNSKNGSPKAEALRKEITSSASIKTSESSQNSSSIRETEQKFKNQDSSSLNKQEIDSRWRCVLEKVALLDDPLLNSIFQQGRFIQFEETTGTLEIGFAKEFSFFNELLENSRQIWQPIIVEQFAHGAQFKPAFIDGQKQNNSIKTIQPINQIPENNLKTITNETMHRTKVYQSRSTDFTHQKRISKQKPIDISDKKDLHKAHLLVSIFPGTIVEVQDFDL